MGKKTEACNVSLPVGLKRRAREQGLSLSGILRAQLREKLILSEEEIMQYRAYLTGVRK